MKDSEFKPVPLMAVVIIAIPFAFAILMLLIGKAMYENPHPANGDCMLDSVGDRIVSRLINGTLELTSGIFVVKDEQNRITALARCGKQFCSGPYHELKGKALKESIKVYFCGKVLMWIEFPSGSTIYPPSAPERR
jgi:hypothetical protein